MKFDILVLNICGWMIRRRSASIVVDREASLRSRMTKQKKEKKEGNNSSAVVS